MDKAVIFDLDDTLYKEIDYLQSGFKYLSKSILTAIGYIQKSILVGMGCETTRH